VSAPATTGVRRRPREWPLVIGMVVAAALVFASTRVGVSEGQSARIPAVSQSAKDAAVTGFADAATSAPAGAPAASRHAAKPRHAATPHRAAKHRKAKTTSAAGAAPAAKAPTQTSSTPKPAAPKPTGTGGTSAPTAAQPPKPQPTSPAPPALSVPADSGQTTIGGITFVVRATHKPVVGEDWTMTVSAARGSAPVTGKVKIDVVYQGKVARHVTTTQLTKGSFSKKIVWPDRSVGYPLTMRIKLSAGGQVCTFLYDLAIQPAA
jgi:hypothetical protein